MKRLILLAGLVFGLHSGDASAAWGLCAGGFNQAGGSTSVNFTLTVAAGETIVIGTVIYDASATMSSITISGESNPTPVGTITRGAAGISNASVQLYVLDHAASSGSKTITMTASAAVPVGMGARCYSGGVAGATLDSGAVSGVTSTTTSITTSVANTLIVEMTVCGGSNAPTTGFTQDLMSHNQEDDQMFYLTSLDAGAAGAKTADFSGTGSAVMQAAAFKPALVAANGSHILLTGAGK